MKIHTERTFSAAHQLESTELTPKEQVSVYGKCEFLHGHNWKVEVDIEADTNKKTGMVFNFSKIKRIIDELDHAFLNELSCFKGIPVTAENLAQYFIHKIAIEYKKERYTLNKGIFISSITVRVWESEKSYAEDYLVIEEV